MSTPAAFPFAGSFLSPAHIGGALVTVFAPIGARHEHRPALGTGPRPSSVEQCGTQPLVCWQDGGAEPFADQGIADTLDTDTRFPAVIKSKAIAAVIIAAGFSNQRIGFSPLLGCHLNQQIVFPPSFAVASCANIFPCASLRFM